MSASSTFVQVADFKLDASRLRRCAEFGTALTRTDRFFAPQPRHEGAHVIRTDNLAPLTAAIELGLFSVSDQDGARQSIVFMADFNARGMGTSLGSLANLAMMGHPRHLRPIVEVSELPIVGSTCGLATQLPVRRSWWQLALTYNAAASIKLPMTATTAEGTLSDLDGTRQLYAALAIAAAVPQLDGKVSHDSRRTGPDLVVDCASHNSRRASVARSMSASVVAPTPNFAATGARSP